MPRYVVEREREFADGLQIRVDESGRRTISRNKLVVERITGVGVFDNRRVARRRQARPSSQRGRVRARVAPSISWRGES